MSNRGLFIVFEGVDGGGKSTQIKLLTDYFKDRGNDVEHHMEPMGAFVESVDGVENGRDGHYWSYYVNGDYGTVAADSKDLEDGDVVRWVFMGNPFG